MIRPILKSARCLKAVALSFSAGALLALAAPAVAADDLTPSQLDFFEKKVRPVLVAHCYSCHSAEAKSVKGHLLLDTKQGWLKGGDTGPAIVPGDPGKSLLIEAIKYENSDIEMPPKAKMPAADIAILEQWVKMGAPDPRAGEAKVPGKRIIDLEAERKHWSYQPLVKPVVPAVKDTTWPRSDIDRFILARLEAANLKPAGDADRVTLIRRVYFDLIGLPPTPSQIDAFVNDKSVDAYEKLVDGLFASPHFGERWGRHWLDVARYAESLSLRGFVLRDTWRYRDYVIETFNRDLPLDRFMMEQVAGDLMTASDPQERRRQVVATAFLAMGNTNLEEQDKQQLVMDVVDEQIDTIGRAFLAQTIGCARCHDHKFDPIPAADYYALAGIFKSTQALEHSNVSKWLEMELPMDKAREEKVREHEAKIAALQNEIKDAKSSLSVLAKNVSSVPKAGVKPKVLAVKDLPGLVVDDAQAKKVGEWMQSQSVSSYIGDGYLHDLAQGKGEKTLTFQPTLTKPGKYEVRLSYTAGESRATNVPVTIFSAEGDKTIAVNQKEPPIVDGHWVSLGVYTFEKDGQGFVIVSNEGTTGHVIADAVQFLPVNEEAALPQGADSEAVKVAKKPEAKTDAKTDAKKDVKEDVKDTSAALAAQIKEMEASLKQLASTGPKRDMITSIRESKQISDAKIHVRGSPHTLGESAPRGFLRVVQVKSQPTISANQSGRLELGHWLRQRDNPLPARVLANRLWHWSIGQGIVRTVDNFGTTGEAPSHPELLDHLATQLMANDWSVKSLLRQIVLSRTYQQKSRHDQPSTGNATATPAAADPDNRLLSHTNRRRLEAEAIRDAMLQVSGQLDLAAGGQTYKEGLSSDFGYAQKDDRRSVYMPVFRNILPEIFEAFDFADPSVSTGKRNTSTVAPQALYLLNHPFVIEQSAAAATKLLADKALTTDDGRLMRAYRLTLGRVPSAAERQIALRFLANENIKLNTTEKWSQIFHAMFASLDFRYVE